MNDREYVIKAFGDSFGTFIDKKIVLYGTGSATEAILNKFSAYNILGVLDKDNDNKYFAGKKILELNEVVDLHVEAIIVVARIQSACLIYRRLKKFCLQYNIQLYGINGKKLEILFDWGKKAEDKACFALKEEQLRKEIYAHDTIVFDIWDTLLMYCTWSKNDLFEILSRRGKDIKEINDLIVARKRMVYYFRLCKEQGKRVILISSVADITGEDLKEVLISFGLTGYDALIENNNQEIKGENCLYIGTQKDIKTDTFFIKSAQDMLRSSSYKAILHHLHGINNRSMIGLFISKVFNDPFVLSESDGRRNVNTAYDIGWMFMGAISTAAALWLIEEVQKGIYDGILFGSRDGYLMQKLYRIATRLLNINDLPTNSYFQVSRLLCWKATLQCDEDILRIWNEVRSAAPEKVLQVIYGIPANAIKTYYSGKYPNVESYILSYRDQIYEHSRQVNENYQKYICQFNFQKGQNYVFFDFVARGGCQYWLGKLLPCKLSGLYVCRHHRYDDAVAEGVNARGFFEEFYNYMPETYLYAHYVDMEQVYTSMSPSILSIDASGLPVYYQESRSATELQYVKDTQQGIIDFFEFYTRAMYLQGDDIDKSLVDLFYRFVSLDYTDEQCRAKDELMLEDGLCMNRYFLSSHRQSTRR